MGPVLATSSHRCPRLSRNLRCSRRIPRSPHGVQPVLQVLQPYVRRLLRGVARVPQYVPVDRHGPQPHVVPLVQGLNDDRIRHGDELQKLRALLARGGVRVRPQNVGQAGPVRPDDCGRPAENVVLLLKGQDLPLVVLPREDNERPIHLVPVHGRPYGVVHIPLVLRLQDAGRSGPVPRVEHDGPLLRPDVRRGEHTLLLAEPAAEVREEDVIVHHGRLAVELVVGDRDADGPPLHLKDLVLSGPQHSLGDELRVEEVQPPLQLSGVGEYEFGRHWQLLA
mmetsp:Transcript_12570/g.37089  ORF Transcript_12570/g.37089 Transcript_12570/m.37089 type:complete len:280 (+) Transcript_12570:60-899(+)